MLTFEHGGKDYQVNELSRQQQRQLWEHVQALHLNRNPANTGALNTLVEVMSGLNQDKTDLETIPHMMLLDQLAAFYIGGMGSKKKPA